MTPYWVCSTVRRPHVIFVLLLGPGFEFCVLVTRQVGGMLFGVSGLLLLLFYYFIFN